MVVLKICLKRNNISWEDQKVDISLQKKKKSLKKICSLGYIFDPCPFEAVKVKKKTT